MLAAQTSLSSWKGQPGLLNIVGLGGRTNLEFSFALWGEKSMQSCGHTLTPRDAGAPGELL